MTQGTPDVHGRSSVAISVSLPSFQCPNSDLEPEGRPKAGAKSNREGKESHHQAQKHPAVPQTRCPQGRKQTPPS